MARPEKHDVDYFPFYVKDGRTLHILETHYGCKGTGFFTNVMRFLCSQPDHHFCIADDADRMYFFSRVKCDEKSGLEMLDIMSKTCKIHSCLWVSYKVIASEDLLGSIFDAYRNRKNQIITINEILQKYVSDVSNSQEPVVSYVGNTQEPVVSDTDNTQTKLNKTNIRVSKDTLSSPEAPCPHQEIINLYNEILGTVLPRVKIHYWKGSVAEKHLISRWRQAEKHQDIEFWKGFFEYIRDHCPFLLGQNGNTSFRADLRWIVKKDNFVKIIEGKYERT
jgi:hypothetical protein